MGWRQFGLGFGLWALLALLPAPAARHPPMSSAMPPGRAADERDYGEFIAAIGASGCRTRGFLPA